MNENSFGEIFRKQDEKIEREARDNRQRRLDTARTLVTNAEGVPNAYISAARTFKQLGHLYEALEILRTGLKCCAPSAALHEYYIERLEKCNQTEAAIEAAQTAAQLFPDKLIFRLREALLLPIFYDSSQQIEHYRHRFTAGLLRLVRETPLESAADRRRALEAIGTNSIKYLPYQGRNDLELQTLYGKWVHRIMTANFPEFAQPLPMPPVEGKIRVGYLSSQAARFMGTSAEKLFGGWIREHDRNQFEVFAYHADRIEHTAEYVARWNVPFRQFSGDLAEITPAIRRDQLHVLVYLDFAMNPRMAQLAALRLAPIQCVTWDIPPMTSGMPTMDYFLSSELMEPSGAQHDYSEKLLPLPGVGVSFQKPVIPKVILNKKRRDFGLSEDAVVYLSCQSVFKYLPDQDAIIAQIATRVRNSQFVFLTTNEVVEKDFRRRVDRAFSDVGLRASDHCVWLPEMPMLDFWNLNLAGDVVLDTLGWSGGVTTFEAIACAMPVVTLPGNLMRARHSFAILTQLGVTETIATDAGEYVDIAVRLGTDRQWRQGVVDRMVAGFSRLYSDMSSVSALEDFYRRVMKESLPQKN